MKNQTKIFDYFTGLVVSSYIVNRLLIKFFYEKYDVMLYYYVYLFFPLIILYLLILLIYYRKKRNFSDIKKILKKFVVWFSILVISLIAFYSTK